MEELVKDQALKVCIDIFKSYHEGGAHMLSVLMNRAWQVGKGACLLNNTKLNPKQAKGCPVKNMCGIYISGKCGKWCSKYPPEG